MKVETGHLLVVDDNEMNRDMLSRRLERMGHSVAVAEDGHKALAMIEAAAYDVVLLDIMMPGINGLDVLKTVRRTRSVAELPVIMVTAKERSEDVVEALKFGANDYVTKPLDFPVVHARIQTQLDMRRLAQLKDEFLRIASHDLKNPLTSVLGAASLIVNLLPPGAAMTEDLYKLALTLGNSARVMKRIIEDFLDFQAMEDGQVRIAREAADANEIARQVGGRNTAYAQDKGIGLCLELAADLPQIALDKHRIGQVMENFIGNAIKFGRRGEATTVRTRLEEGDFVFEVADSGPGLSEEDFKRVFTKYARLSNKPTGGEKSSGLGLAICKQLIELHEGRVGVQNNPGGGATFWFRLPARQARD